MGGLVALNAEVYEVSSRGAYIWLVGPDGAGKSTLVSALNAETAEVVYWRPAVLPMAKRILGRPSDETVNSAPHGRTADSSLRATARVVYYFVDHLLGYWLRVKPVLRAGRDFVIDRGWADMVVDPKRYGFQSARLPRLAMRLLPTPDAIVIVSVDPWTAHSRKPELPVGEIVRQYQAWDDFQWRSIPTILVRNEGSPTKAQEELRATLSGLRAT